VSRVQTLRDDQPLAFGAHAADGSAVPRPNALQLGSRGLGKLRDRSIQAARSRVVVPTAVKKRAHV
jgi:hypothetical protein